MANQTQIKHRHIEEKTEHILKRNVNRTALFAEHIQRLDALAEHPYGSTARSRVLIMHSLELRELMAVNADAWAKMIIRHKEELEG